MKKIFFILILFLISCQLPDNNTQYQEGLVVFGRIELLETNGIAIGDIGIIRVSLSAEINANLNYRFTDEQRGELEPWAVQPKFNLLDARVTWTNSDDTFDVSLWGRNLTDEKYVSHIYAIASSIVAVYGDPRTFGLSASYRF